MLANEGDDLIIEYYGVLSMLFVKGERPQKRKKSRKPPNMKAKQMFSEIEDKIGRLLTHNEMDSILSWVDEYKFTYQTIVLIIDDCVKREKRSFSYWESMASVYHDLGITTFDQAQQYIQSRDSRWKEYNEIIDVYKRQKTRRWI